MKSRTTFIILIATLFVVRIVYGLTAEFWFEDELQIYLIGLKSYTTGTWPFYGPDVVYTGTQIPGALQGLLISLPLYILPVPEAPAIFLNIISFASLGLLAYYITIRVPSISKWIIWIWVMTLTWTMDFSTRTVNPSYVLVFSIPFFIAAFELLQIFQTKFIGRKAAFFILGITTLLIMQLHLSYVLLIPFIIAAFYTDIRSKIPAAKKITGFLLFICGALAGMTLLLPTLLIEGGLSTTGSNIVFRIDNFNNIITVLTRFLSFASYEVPYILGGNTASRLGVIRENIWMAPFTIYLLVFGFLLIAAFIFVFIMNRSTGEWKKIKWITFLTFVILWLSFFFSVKGPSSHTFYLLLPIPVIYSFFCHEWLLNKFRFWKILMYTAMICLPFFYTGLGIYNYRHKSMYRDRERIVKAIEEKDYRILGERRPGAKY